MTTPSVGAIVSIEFPFTDMQGRKRRPGLVLAVDEHDLVLARVTTHQPRDSFDLLLAGWAEARLPRPSTVRLRKIIAIDRRLVHHTIGRLSAVDRMAVAAMIERFTAEIVSRLRQAAD